MLNKKQILIGGAVALILLGTVGVFWYVYQVKSNHSVSDKQSQTQEDSISQQPVLGTPTDYIELDGMRVGMAVPEKWGHLVVPHVQSDSEAPGFQRVINVPVSFDAEEEYGFFFDGYPIESHFFKLISNYTFPLKSEHLDYDHNGGTALPLVTIARLPQVFQDDLQYRFGANFTAEEKQRDIGELFRTWDERRITFSNINRQSWIVDFPEVSEPNSELNLKFGKQSWIYWWGAEVVSQDRVAPKYFESKDGSFRGLGFFVTLGNEPPAGFYQYRVVMVNPDTRVVVQIDLPLSQGSDDSLIRDDWDSLSKSKIPTDSEDYEAEYKKIRNDIRLSTIDAYRYVENEENYSGTELEFFMQDIQSLVGSLQFVQK